MKNKLAVVRASDPVAEPAAKLSALKIVESKIEQAKLSARKIFERKELSTRGSTRNQPRANLSAL